jgi:hypothetical protein
VDTMVAHSGFTTTLLDPSTCLPMVVVSPGWTFAWADVTRLSGSHVCPCSAL